MTMMSGDREAVDYMLCCFDKMNLSYSSEDLMRIPENVFDKFLSLHKSWRDSIKNEACIVVGPGGNKKNKMKRKNAKQKVINCKRDLDTHVSTLMSYVG
jgi:hypothetical protein